jgi:PAS domain S-box-containing protein
MTEKKINILMVEDDWVDRIAIKRLIQEKNLPYNLDEAGSYKEALEKLAHNNFDIVISDYNLGDGDGLEVVKKCGETPVIIITGSGDEEIAAKAVRMGAYDYLIKDPDRNYLSVLPSTVHSVLKRKAIEEALRSSEERYRLIVEGARIVGWEYDPSIDCFTFVSGHAERIFGYPAKQWYEKGFWADHIHPDDREDVVNYCVSCTREGEDHEFEYRMLSKDGEVVWCRDIVHVIVKEGKPTKLGGILIDITELKRIEEELRESKEKAEEATILKDKFVSLVAHDLRSPFTSILGLLNVVLSEKEQKLNDKYKEFLNHALSSGNSALKLIDDLLNVTRLQSGKVLLKQKFVDARTMSVLAVGNLSHIADRKGIKIVNNIKEGTRLYADINLFTEVIHNLLSNAIKFSNEGDVITVSIAGDTKTTIAVEDHGVGIDHEMLSKIFAYDEKTTTYGTAGEKGTGLGLPLSNDIMRAHGGTLETQSAKGEGSVFYAQLPYVRPELLIIDDDPIASEAIANILKDVGANISKAGSGEEAIELMKQTRPHLILLDLYLPKMDGFEILEKIESDKELNGIPVIVVTGRGEKDVREKAFRLGADDFITKNITEEELVPRVRKHIV